MKLSNIILLKNFNEGYIVLEKLSKFNFKIKFINTGYITKTNKINIETGSIKDRYNFDEFYNFVGKTITTNNLGEFSINGTSFRAGEKVFICESLDKNLKLILTKEQVVSKNLEDLGIPAVKREKPLDVIITSNNTLYNGDEFNTVDFDLLNTLFYIKDGLLYHRLIRKDSVNKNIYNAYNKLAGKLAGYYRNHNSLEGRVKILGVMFNVFLVKKVLLGEIDCCSKIEFKTSRITQETLQQEYNIWNNMVYRCKKGYAILSDDFEDFWEWLEWAKQQKGFMCKDMNGGLYQMESDLFSEIKTYSKETVVFVPNTINQMCKPTKKGDLPKGVQYFPNKKNNKYRAYSTEFGKQIHLGYYSELKEAENVVKNSRISYINKLKTIYEGSVEDKVFDALLEDRWV